MEQRTEEWFAARLGKVTASKVADALMGKTTAGYQNYRSQLVCERLTGRPTMTFQSAAMLHGTETEPQARAMFMLETGLAVEETGLIDHPSREWCAASPDGLIGADGLIEIKCPQPTEHIRSLSGGAIQKKYALQMQWQMECTGRDWCDFVSFCPDLPDHLQMHVQRVERDTDQIADMLEGVGKFLADVEQIVTNLQERAA